MDSTTNKTTVTGARALVDALLREGIEHVFGIPGTQNLAILDALRETPQIRFILTRHEQGAAFMAYGYARAKRAPAVVTATEGPGLTNLATGIAAAYKAYVPLISICGIQESLMQRPGCDAGHRSDLVHAPDHQVGADDTDADKVQEFVRKAFRVALTEPQGPTHIDASSEILLEPVTLEPIEPARYRNVRSARVRSASSSTRWSSSSRRAQRPVFVVGRGVISEGATQAMAELADRTGIPVAALQYSPDAFPIDASRSRSAPLGRNGFGSANRIVPQADLIVAIGAHIDVFSTTFKYGLFSEQAKLVHHSAAPGQIGIVFPVTLGVTGSTMSFVEGPHRACDESGAEEVVGRRAESARGLGSASCRARCVTKPSPSSRSSSRT